MNKTVLFTAAACALLMLASCGGGSKDSSSSGSSGSGSSGSDAAKLLKGAKDAASAFSEIAKQLEGGDAAAAIASIEAAIPLLKQEKATPESLFRYELTKDGSGVKILGPADGATFSGTLVFPDTIEGLPVKEIKKMKSDIVTAIIVPEGVTYFGGFEGIALMYVSLPSTIASLETDTFSSCKKLARIDIPENAPLQTIPYHFASETALAQFKFPSAVKNIGCSAFMGTKLTSVEIPDGVEVLGLGSFGDRSDSFVLCFASCKELTSVKLPKSLQYVGPSCFSGCSNLTDVIVPDGIGQVIWKRYATSNDSFEGTHLNLKSQAAVKAIGYKDAF